MPCRRPNSRLLPLGFEHQYPSALPDCRSHRARSELRVRRRSRTQPAYESRSGVAIQRLAVRQCESLVSLQGDNITKVRGNHSFKAGIYLEHAIKTESAFGDVNSTIAFGRDSLNPGDTNWAFSNALLGNFQSLYAVQPIPGRQLSHAQYRMVCAGQLEGHS